MFPIHQRCHTNRPQSCPDVPAAGSGTKINTLRAKIEEQEIKHRNDLRIGYTQMQEAIPSSYGKLLEPIVKPCRAIGGGFEVF